MRVSLVGLAGFAACTPADGPKAEDTVPAGEHAQGFEVGDAPLDFVLRNADGDEVRLSDHQGSRIVVVGTASW